MFERRCLWSHTDEWPHRCGWEGMPRRVGCNGGQEGLLCLSPRGRTRRHQGNRIGCQRRLGARGRVQRYPGCLWGFGDKPNGLMRACIVQRCSNSSNRRTSSGSSNRRTSSGSSNRRTSSNSSNRRTSSGGGCLRDIFGGSRRLLPFVSESFWCYSS